jgi:hypothetical protein
VFRTTGDQVFRSVAMAVTWGRDVDPTVIACAHIATATGGSRAHHMFTAAPIRYKVKGADYDK